MDNFYANGINFRFRQTGFIDAYNWQPVSSASLISVGNVNGINVDDLIAKFSDMIIRGNSAFANRRIIDSNDVCWIHVAIVTAGITTGFTIENTYADVNIQDKRLSYFNTNEMQIEQTSPLAKSAKPSLNKRRQVSGATTINKTSNRLRLIWSTTRLSIGCIQNNVRIITGENI